MIKTKPKKIPGSGSVDGLRTPNYTSSETAKKMKKKTGRKTRFLWLYFVLSIKIQIKILFVFFALWRTKHDPSTFKKSASCVAYTKGNVLIDFEGKARHFDGGLVGSVRKILGRKMLHEEAKVNLKRFDTSQFLPRNIVPGAHKVMFTNHLHFHQSAVEIGWGTIQLLAICPWVIQQPSVQNILRLRVMTSAPKKKIHIIPSSSSEFWSLVSGSPGATHGLFALKKLPRRNRRHLTICVWNSTVFSSCSRTLTWRPSKLQMCYRILGKFWNASISNDEIFHTSVEQPAGELSQATCHNLVLVQICKLVHQTLAILAVPHQPTHDYFDRWKWANVRNLQWQSALGWFLTEKSDHLENQQDEKFWSFFFRSFLSPKTYHSNLHSRYFLGWKHLLNMFFGPPHCASSLGLAVASKRSVCLSGLLQEVVSQRLDTLVAKWAWL